MHGAIRNDWEGGARTTPSSSAMALSALAWSAMVTNPKPRERPDSLSRTTVISEASYSPNRSPSEASSMPQDRFPTYSFTGPAAGASAASSSAANAVRWNARAGTGARNALEKPDAAMPLK